ncbi:hypothetical protein KLP28_10640 [Nocardioidaceae bacterium]|nr:hypothetical protein KLP28_10640 [Nocardioidaceae bacterium]
MRLSRRPAALVTTVVALAAMMSACGEGDGPDSPSAVDNPTVQATTSDSDLAEETTASDDPAEEEALDEAFEAPVLTVQVRDDRVRPNSAELDLKRGSELTIRVDTDRAIELHVHSSPEQYLDFEPGRSSQTVTFERAGVVEIEEHESGQVLAQVTVE